MHPMEAPQPPGSLYCRTGASRRFIPGVATIRSTTGVAMDAHSRQPRSHLMKGPLCLV